MKKYMENQTISLFVAEDGLFHMVTEDSDEVLPSEYRIAVAAYFTARMNEALSKGFSAEDFVEVSAVTDQAVEDPIEYAQSDVQTLDMQRMEEDFNSIKKQAYHEKEMPDYKRWCDANAFQSMKGVYLLYDCGFYDINKAESQKRMFFNRYTVARKQEEDSNKIYRILHTAHMKTSQRLTALINGADTMSKDELIEELLNIVSLAIGEEVTAKQIRKKLKGRVND